MTTSVVNYYFTFHSFCCRQILTMPPPQECDRCAMYHYTCSATTTANQGKQLQQNVASGQSSPDRQGQDQPGLQPAIHEIQQPKGASSGKAAIVPSPNPKCACYFATLMEAQWKCFGLSSLCQSTFDLAGLFIKLEASKANTVYYTLQSRIAVVGLTREYTTSVKDGFSRGMSEEAVRAFIFQKTMFDLGMPNECIDMRAFEWKRDKLIEGFDKSISCALRWKRLYDEIGVPEVFLIRSEPAVTDNGEQIPDLDFMSLSDEKYESLMNRLLSPTLGLKETCLKLSGVVDMIQRLRELNQLAVQRDFLAEELERRVKNVLGDHNYLYGSPDGDFDCSKDGGDDDDDESMLDIEAC